MSVMPGPFVSLCTYLDISLSDARKLWSALEHSQWSEARALRQSFGLRRGLARGICSPPNLIKVLEALVKEGRFTRCQANMYEAAVLAKTRQGQWIVIYSVKDRACL